MNEFYSNKSSNVKKRKIGKNVIKRMGLISIMSVLLLFIFVVSFKSLISKHNKSVQAAYKSSTTTLATNKTTLPKENKAKSSILANGDDKNKTNNDSSNHSKDNITNTNTNKNNSGNVGNKNIDGKNKKAIVKEDKNDKRVNADKAFTPDGQKVAFLTFDDGPSIRVTPRILDTLKKYNIKATFFVTGASANENPNLIKREYAEGHSIGNHSYTHNYSEVYRNLDSFTNEINTTNNAISSAIGKDYPVELFRFPGGSFEKRKNPFKENLKERGFRHIDWNALTGDAEGHNISPDRLLHKLKQTTAGHEHVVILMHDTGAKSTTAQALPSVIEYLKSQGYIFKTLK